MLFQSHGHYDGAPNWKWNASTESAFRWWNGRSHDRSQYNVRICWFYQCVTCNESLSTPYLCWCFFPFHSPHVRRPQQTWKIAFEKLETRRIVDESHTCFVKLIWGNHLCVGKHSPPHSTHMWHISRISVRCRFAILVCSVRASADRTSKENQK